MTPEQKEWIDKASYQELLKKWRFEPAGSPWFQGNAGDYYIKVMEQKKLSCNNPEEVSKQVGWER